MNNIISFFGNDTRVVNIFSLKIGFSTFLALTIPVLTISFFFLFYTVYTEYSIKKRLKDKNIKVLNKGTKKYFLPNVVAKNFDREEMALKFIHCGNVLGIKSLELYFLFKIIFTIGGLFVGLELYNPAKFNLSIGLILGFGILGFFITDILLKQGRKKRVKIIQEQLPMFLMSLDNYNKSGLLFEDILDIIPKTLSGYLQKEVVRFNLSYSLSKDFEGSVKEFVRRLGCPEAEEIEVKLRQCYYSGIYDDVLTNEKELIEKKVIADIKKESEISSLYLGIAMGLLVFNLFILIVLPLISMASTGLKGAMSL